MIEIGIITRSDVAANKDSDVQRPLMQVQILDEDVKTGELFSGHGEDSRPAKNCRAVLLNISDSYQLVIAVSDDLPSEVAEGEKEIYATDAACTEKKARIKWGGDGVVTINQGTRSLVTYADLNTALQTLVSAINTALGTKQNGSGSVGTLSLDMSAAESGTVKVL